MSSSPRPAALVAGLWRSTHPGPTLVVTALSLALGIAAGVAGWRLVLLVAAVFAGQVSVGLSNDAIDARRDAAVGRADKPIAGGAVSVRAAFGVALAALVLALALSLALGVGMLAAHAVALAGAWGYNAWLKSTPASIVPFVVSFGLFPSLATLSAPEPSVAPAWAGVAGAALGAAVHLSNVVRDLDEDAATGVRGLPHRLGARASMAIAALGVLAGGVAVLLGPAGAPTPVAWGFFAGVGAVASVALARAARGARPTRIDFRLVMVAALSLAVQLVVAGGAL